MLQPAASTAAGVVLLKQLCCLSHSVSHRDGTYRQHEREKDWQHGCRAQVANINHLRLICVPMLQTSLGLLNIQPRLTN